MALRKRFYITLLTVLFSFSSLKLGLSQTIMPEKDHKWELSLGTGYFSPTRKSFREYYGSNFLYEIGVAYKISSLFRVGADFFYTRLSKSEYPVKYSMFSFVPSIKVVLPLVQYTAFYLGGGPGYYRATIKLDIGPVKERFAQSGVGLKVYAGFKYSLSQRMFSIIEGVYDHIYLGEPEKGNYGNVSGLSGMIKLGISL
jgi:hypothetical protein